MYVRVSQLREFSDSLGKALDEGAFIAYFESMEIVSPDKFDVSSSPGEHWAWDALHKDDSILYEMYHLQELYNICLELIDNKISLEPYVHNSHQDGSIVLNLEDLYRLRYYPKHLRGNLEKMDWTKNPPQHRDGFITNEDIEYELKQLSQVPGGFEKANQVWDETVTRPHLKALLYGDGHPSANTCSQSYHLQPATRSGTPAQTFEGR